MLESRVFTVVLSFNGYCRPYKKIVKFSCPFPNFGKFGKHAPAVAAPWGSLSVLSLVLAKGNTDIKSAQAVQDEASLSPAAKRLGFSTAPRPQVSDAHGSHSVAATIRPLEVWRTAIARELLCWHDHTDKSGGERTFQRNYRLFSRMRVLQDLLISTEAVSEFSVCGVPVSFKVRKYVQTVPKRIMLIISKRGCLFPNLYLNR